MNLPLSLIIPSHNATDGLSSLLQGIADWSIFPAEIVVVDSSETQPFISKNCVNFFNNTNIKFSLIHEQNLYPGKARNIGISYAAFENYAFLDISTVPSSSWLEDSWKIYNQDLIDGVWGRTKYKSYSWFQKIIRASTYGELPIITLPGSIIHKKVFEKAGLFIESTRAGEDADWMNRVSFHDLKFVQPNQFLTYIGLKHMNFFFIIKKWFRNNLHAAKLPYLNAHKDFYFYFIAIFIILIAFNWNNLSYDYEIGGWNTESFAYIPNITKLSIFFFGFLYIFSRAVLLPLKKGANIIFLTINFPIIVSISFILDFVKLVAFLCARIFHLKL